MSELPELEHVPTCAELAQQKLAKPVAWTQKGSVTHYRLEPEGEQLLSDIMRRNGDKLRAHREANPDTTTRRLRAAAAAAESARSWAESAFAE